MLIRWLGVKGISGKEGRDSFIIKDDSYLLLSPLWAVE